MVTQSPEIKKLILEWYERIAGGEMVAAAEYFISRDQCFLAIGTDIGEAFMERADLIQVYRETAGLGPPQIKIQRLEAYQEGSIGWAVDLVLFSRPGQNEIPMRHSFVLHREGNAWKVIHAHYSFPIPEERFTSTEASQ